MAKLYPISIDVNVHITNGDSEGSAKFNFGLNRIPTEEDMPEIMKKVLAALPEDFRLMNRHESMMFFLRETKGYTGPNLALSSLDEGDEWHDPATANDYSKD